MTGVPTIILPSNATEDTGATKIVSPAEQALARLLQARGGRWWHARHGLDANGWTCMVSGLQAVPAPAVGSTAAHGLPDIFSSGGPDNVPYGEGKSSDPAGILLTPSGVDVINAAADWSIMAVANDGSGTQTGLCGIVGNNGGAVSLKLRTSNIAELATYSGSTATARFSANSVTSGAWRVLECGYDLGTGVAKLYDNGAAATNGTSGSFAHTPATKRLSIFGGFDLQIDIDREGRDLGIAHLIAVPGVVIHEDSELRAAWRAMVEDQMPSLLS